MANNILQPNQGGTGTKGEYANSYFDDGVAGTFSAIGYRIDDTISGLRDNYTKEYITFVKATGYTDADINGVTVRKKGSEYFRRVEEVNVLHFGATGNGSTDDTTAIQNCINALGYSGVIKFPKVKNSTTYKTTSVLTVSNNWVQIQGVGKGVVINSRGNNNAFNVTGQFVAFKDISIFGTGGAFGVGADPLNKGISVTGGNIHFDNCIIRYFGGNGILITGGSNICSVVNTEVSQNGGDGINSVSTSGADQNGNNMSLINSSFNNNTGSGVKWKAASFNATGCVFEANKTNGILLDCTGTSNSLYGITVTGNYFESNELGDIKGVTITGVTLTGGEITGNYFFNQSTRTTASLVFSGPFATVRNYRIGKNVYFFGGTVVYAVDGGNTFNRDTFVDNSFNIGSQFVNLSIAETRFKIEGFLTKTADYSIADVDFGTNGNVQVYVDATAGDVTITLPSSVLKSGYSIDVIKIDGSANTVIVTRYGTEKINGLNTDVLYYQYQASRYKSNGGYNQWFKVNNSTSWSYFGNKIDANSFLGSTNAFPVSLKVNSIERAVFNTDGSVTIGDTTNAGSVTVTGSSFVQINAKSNQPNTSGGFYAGSSTGETLALEAVGSTATGLVNQGVIYGRTGLTKINIGLSRSVAYATWDLSTGYYGLGNNSPATNLHVGAGTIQTIKNGGGTSITPQIYNAPTSGTSMLGVCVQDGTNNYRLGMWADDTNSLVGFTVTGTSGTPDFVIRSGTREYLRMLSTGAVGIGITTPGFPLEVRGTAGVIVGIKSTAAASNEDALSQYQARAVVGWDGTYVGLKIATLDNGKPIIFSNSTTGGAGEFARFSGSGNFGIGVTPTAVLHLKAGTATASTAPIKFTSGTNLTTAETGAMEYNGTNLFFTRTGTTRENVITTSAVNSVSPTSPNRTLTIVIDGTTYYLHAKTTND